MGRALGMRIQAHYADTRCRVQVADVLAQPELMPLPAKPHPYPTTADPNPISFRRLMIHLLGRLSACNCTPKHPARGCSDERGKTMEQPRPWCELRSVGRPALKNSKLKLHFCLSPTTAFSARDITR